MRTLAVTSSLGAAELRSALGARAPLRLELLAAPAAISREELLGAAARAEALVVVRFSGTLASPLAELALLAHAAEFEDGARLDLAGALLTPLVARVGHAAARRLLANGPALAARDVLPRFAGPRNRSAEAVRIASALLRLPESPRELLAAERAAFAMVMALTDRSEGVLAFREKRPARFDW